MHVIFLDGESKSGKTAVGRSILRALEDENHNVRLLVAGHYFRHLTVLTLQQLGNDKYTDVQLETAARQALKDEALLRPIDDPDTLEKPIVETTVSRLAQHGFVQDAASEWRVASAQRALDDGVEILLFDGRNTRLKLHDWLKRTKTDVALELIIYCRPEVAGRRYLGDDGNNSPSHADVREATDMVQKRRQRDRERSHAAYQEPTDTVSLIVGKDTVEKALEAAFDFTVADPPRPIRFDNSEVPRDDGLRTVTELALEAIKRQ